MAIALLSLSFLLQVFVGGVQGQPVTADEVIARLAEGGHFRGKSQAPVTIIEFSDFRCSFCRKFWQDTLPAIEKNYISTGKVRFVYRHLVMLGPQSLASAQAAECAGEQGRFWQYHDLLFNHGASAAAFSDARLKAYARELKLKDADFNRCLDSGKYRSKAEGETALAVSLGIRGTPAFIINGQLLVGAQPYKVFESIIEKEIGKGAAAKKSRP